MANLLGKSLLYLRLKRLILLFSEVSKGDEIMPAIKTLKLLAHGDGYSPTQSQSLKRVSSLTTRKNPTEKPLTQSKSLRTLSSKSNENQIKQSEEINADSEQPTTGTDEGDS